MNSDRDQTFRDALSAADPARTQAPLTGAERTRLRARLLGAAAGSREVVAAPGGLRWVGLVATVTLLAAVGLWVLTPIDTGEAPVAPADPLAPRHAAVAPDDSALRPRTALRPRATNDLPARRSIHFTAPRGTRLVWIVTDDEPAGRG